MIESTILNLIEKYLEVKNEITYDPLELHTRLYFRGNVAFSHTLDLTELENHLLDKVNKDVPREKL